MIFKYNPPQGSKARIRAVSKNFFLHFHSVKIHLYSLKPGFTLGLGVINVALFLILLFSGILLLFYYKPSLQSSYSSIIDINNIVSGGRYLRNMHRWAAHGLVFTAMLHMARAFYTAAYRGGQRLTWHLGIGLLLVTLFASFSGYLLTWDQLGFWAVTIASNILGSTRELTDLLHITTFFDPGLILKNLFLGGNDVGQQALTRFFMFHIVLLPIVFVLLMALHFWRIRKNDGLNLPDNADQLALSGIFYRNAGKSNTTADLRLLSWPLALYAEIAVFMIILAVLSAFAFLIDAPLKEMANAALPENPAKAPWYFLGVQELVSYSAFGGGLLLPVLVIAFLFAVPYLDVQQVNTGIWFTDKGGRKVSLTAALIALGVNTLMMLLIVNLGWFRDWLPLIPQPFMILINPGMLGLIMFSAFAYYLFRRSASSRLALLALFTTIAVGYIFYTVIGIWFRGPDWMFMF
jgi:quinol-cytochrome oxidoreductase complex cytochrome b subunit